MGLNFDGVDDVVSYGEGADPTAGGGTWSFFVSFDDTPTDTPAFFSNVNSAESAQAVIYFPGNATLAFFVSGSTFMQKIESPIGPSVTAFDGTAYHVLVTWTGSDAHSGVHIYVNNAEISYDASSQDGVSLTAVGDKIFIGDAFGSANPHDGSLAEMAYWDGVVLNSSERTALFNHFSPALIRPSSLSFYAPFISNAVPHSKIGGAPSVTGTVKVDHIRMIYPAAPSAIFVPAAAGISIDVPAGALTLTGFSPSLDFGFPVPRADLTLTGFAPSVVLSGSFNITIPAGTLTLAGFSPILDFGFVVAKGDLTLTTAAPTIAVTANHPITVPSGTLTLTGTSPALDFGFPVPAGVLTLTGFVPTAILSGNVDIVVPAGALTLTGFASVLDFGFPVPAGTLTLSSAAPVIAVTVNVIIAVPRGDLALTGFAPSLDFGFSVPKGTLTLTGFAPAVQVGASVGIIVPAGALTLSSAAPVAVITENRVITVPAGALILSSAAPDVSTEDVVIVVPSGTMTITSAAPAIIHTQGQDMIGGATLKGRSDVVTLAGQQPAIKLKGQVA